MISFRSLLAFVLCAAVLVISSQASAQKAEEVSEAEATDGQQNVLFGRRFGPSWDGREDYSDRYQSEFVIKGGDYLGENWKNTYYIGGAYYFHFNEIVAVGGQYIYSPIVVDKDTPFYRSLTTSDTHIATAQCMLNTPAAFRVGDTIFNMDFYFNLGVGAMQINRQWEVTGVIGGGAKFYFPVPWIAFRLDINSYLHNTPMATRDNFSGDVALGGGISFLFPTKRIRD